MTKAQTAWAVLTGMFLTAAIVLFLVDGSTGDEAGRTVAAWLCLVVSLLGFGMLTAMLFLDRRA